MTRGFNKVKAVTTVSNSGSPVLANAATIHVAANGATDMPTSGTFCVLVVNTGLMLEVTGGAGTQTWTIGTWGIDGTSSLIANIPDGAPLEEVLTARDLTQFVQRSETAVPTSLLATTTPIVEGTGAVGTSTKAARADHVHPASGSGAADATTSTVGSVEIDHAPSGAHPIAMTLDGLAIPSGMLGATTPTSAGTGAAGTATTASRSDHVHPLVSTFPAHINATGTAPAIAAGAGLGTAPPTPTIAGNDQRGTVTFGTGTGTPANGAAVTLTFNVVFAAAPVIALTSANSATALLAGQWYVSAVSTTAATLSFSGTFAASQGATVYKVNYVAIG